MPEGEIMTLKESKRWSKTSICEIGNYLWDNLTEIRRAVLIVVRTLTVP